MCAFNVDLHEHEESTPLRTNRQRLGTRKKVKRLESASLVNSADDENSDYHPTDEPTASATTSTSFSSRSICINCISVCI